MKPHLIFPSSHGEAYYDDERGDSLVPDGEYINEFAINVGSCIIDINYLAVAGGKMHNDTGPAVVFADGDEWWYLYGLHHNTEGPACVTHIPGLDTEYEFYIHGTEYTFKVWCDITEKSNEDRIFLKLKYNLKTGEKA
jgi:hypothetical protein